MPAHAQAKLLKLETISTIQKQSLLLLAATGEGNNHRYQEFSTLTVNANGLAIQFITETFIAIDILEQLRITPKGLKARPFRLKIETSGEKLFDLQWDVSGARRLLRFKRGPWEAQLQKLYDQAVTENIDFTCMLLLAGNLSLVENEHDITHY